MNAHKVSALLLLTAVSIMGGELPATVAAAAEPAAIQREIIPGSELMNTQERERYRLRLRGAGTPEERERLRAEHVKAMEARAQLQGLKVTDPTRERKAAP